MVARLAPLFFVSGVAALVYQVCWQRLLFAAFGVDIDSVTIIVSVFMLGLGLGALVGGDLADRRPGWALRFFALAELGIGVFGLFSPGADPGGRRQPSSVRRNGRSRSRTSCSCCRRPA